MAELLIFGLGVEIREEMLTVCCIVLMRLVSLHLCLPLALCILSGFDVFELGSITEGSERGAFFPSSDK